MLKYLIQRVTFPLLAYRDGLYGIMKDLSELEESQYWPEERLLNLQRDRLKILLIHAFENTIFYKKRFNDSGFNPYTFKYMDELLGIPILTKDQIRENVKGMIARNYRDDEIHLSETGGTSGVKMRFYRDNKCLSKKEAAIHRFGKWTGWDIGEYMGLVWPAHQDFIGCHTWKSKIKNEFYRRQVIFPAAIIDDRMCEAYVRELLKKRPSMILAFSSPIHELARYMEKKGIDDVYLKGIISTGEPFYEHQRKLVSKVFHCDVFDSYRSREAGPMAQECEAHQGMHINAEYLYIELDNNQKTRPDEGESTGEVVVTDLLNYGMPLIRYNMGDMAVMKKTSCTCGRGLPMIDRIVGRSLDVFVTPEGKLISTIALVMYLVNGAPGLIGQMQVIQNTSDHLTFLMTKDPLPTKTVMDHQKKIVAMLFGDEMKITYEFVDDIPREKSGKYLFAKRLIPIPE